MKKSVSALGLALLFCVSHAFAQQPVADDHLMADQCLSDIKIQYQTNPQITALLKGARIKEHAFVLERYDANVGSQHIASEINATVEQRDRVIGQILCLIDENKILYKTFFATQEQ
ncbi:MAG: hypothetical protein WAK61_14645 [Leclercia sp.]